jgi:hypothetical protein
MQRGRASNEDWSEHFEEKENTLNDKGNLTHQNVWHSVKST